jgi:hypothetical protein
LSSGVIQLGVEVFQQGDGGDEKRIVGQRRENCAAMMV